jgi:hypothetical protein
MLSRFLKDILVVAFVCNIEPSSQVHCNAVQAVVLLHLVYVYVCVCVCVCVYVCVLHPVCTQYRTVTAGAERKRLGKRNRFGLYLYFIRAYLYEYLLT